MLTGLSVIAYGFYIVFDTYYIINGKKGLILILYRNNLIGWLYVMLIYAILWYYCYVYQNS